MPNTGLKYDKYHILTKKRLKKRQTILKVLLALFFF